MTKWGCGVLCAVVLGVALSASHRHQAKPQRGISTIARGRAEGVAPGTPAPILASPEGATGPVGAPTVGPPRWGLVVRGGGVPRAMPWAVILSPRWGFLPSLMPMGVLTRREGETLDLSWGFLPSLMPMGFRCRSTLG
jgi:hypothetical protein